MLDKGVALLDVVERHPVTVTELAREVGMTVPTCHRLATAMITHGLLRRDAAGLLHLGHRFLASTLVEIARPVLADLTAQTGESTQLWVRRGDLRVVVVSVESQMELRASLPVGSQLPLTVGGSAAALLVAQNVADIAPQGWVESVSQRTPGLGSVSAPVMSHGEVVAAVCLPAPVQRLQPSPGRVYGELVVAAARQIEAGLRG